MPKRTLELEAAQKLSEGLEGPNKEQREARLRLDLRAEHEALARAEDALTEAKAALEIARLEWTLARCQVEASEAPRLLAV